MPKCIHKNGSNKPNNKSVNACHISNVLSINSTSKEAIRISEFSILPVFYVRMDGSLGRRSKDFK